MRYIKKKSKKSGVMFYFTVILLIFSILFVVFESKARPVMIANLKIYVKTYASFILNDVVSDEISNSDLEYNDLVSIKRDDSGNALSIHLNSADINKFKATINNTAIKSLSQLQEKKFDANIGNLTGIDYMIGRGPKIYYPVEVSGFSESEVFSSFEEAGINQTLHKINLKLDLTVYASIPGYQTSCVVSSVFCIAETLIVGSTPSIFKN